MNAPNLQELLSTAKEAVEVASAFLVEEQKKAFQEGKSLEIKTKSSETDFVTRVDTEVQGIIIQTIQNKFPDHRFLAEEEGADDLGDPSCSYEWIIDPLDGTLNFIHNREWFGSIVAVRRENDILAGAMRMPLLDQTFYGARGLGVFFNGEPVRLSGAASMTEAVLCCNTIRRAKTNEQGELLVPVPYCASIENYGCAALELGEILRGKIDGAFFKGIPLWDIAAGFMMIEEAGGRMRIDMIEPDNPRSGTISAATVAPIFDDVWAWMEEEM